MRNVKALLGIGVISLISGGIGSYSTGFAHAALIWGSNSIAHKEVARCDDKQNDSTVTKRIVVLSVNYDNFSIGEVECAKLKK